MTYSELAEWIMNLSEDQKGLDVIVFDDYEKKFYRVCDASEVDERRVDLLLLNYPCLYF